MTAKCIESKKKSFAAPIKALICIILFIASICFGSALKEGVIYGFKICFMNIIPTLFPFFILSDLWSAYISFPPDSRLFGLLKPLGLDYNSLDAFLIGNVCGFPLGAKILTAKYNSGIIGKEELTSLIPLCTNPSLAFVVSGIGAGLLGSIKVGFLLYFSTIISSVLIYLAFPHKSENAEKSAFKSEQSFSLVDSIKNAGISCITISSFIIFFSAIIGLAKFLIKNEIILSIVSAFFEVGSACSIISEHSGLLDIFYLPLIAFSLSFSGISVFLQVLSVTPSDLSKRRYLSRKLLQGILSAGITFLILQI